VVVQARYRIALLGWADQALAEMDRLTGLLPVVQEV
jgi:hypothetical protein